MRLNARLVLPFQGLKFHAHLMSFSKMQCIWIGIQHLIYYVHLYSGWLI